MGNDERADLHKVAATQNCPRTLVSARSIGPYIRTAPEQDERSDESRETHRADLRLTGLNVSASHTPRFGGVSVSSGRSVDVRFRPKANTHET